MNQFLLIGLGNPGDNFTHTRHNLGLDTVEKWVLHVKSSGAVVHPEKVHESFHAREQLVEYSGITITILKQIVFMNESGKMLAQYLRYHEFNRKNILVVHDDLELGLGVCKVQEEGSAHGHNGIRSIHEYLGDTNIPRLRIGIGRPGNATPIEKFVLSAFTPGEKKALAEKEPEILEKITRLVI